LLSHVSEAQTTFIKKEDEFMRDVKNFMGHILDQHNVLDDGKLVSSEIPRLNVDGLSCPEYAKKKLKALKNVHGQVQRSQLDNIGIDSKMLRNELKDVKEQAFELSKNKFIIDLGIEIYDRKIQKLLRRMYSDLPTINELQTYPGSKLKELITNDIDIMKLILNNADKTKKMSTRDLATMDTINENIEGYKKKQLADLQVVLRSLVNSKPEDLNIDKIADLIKDALKCGEDHFKGQQNFDESRIIDDLEEILKKIPLHNDKQLSKEEIED